MNFWTSPRKPLQISNLGSAITIRGLSGAVANKLLEEILTGETADETPALVERAELLSDCSTDPSWTPEALRLSRSPAV